MPEDDFRTRSEISHFFNSVYNLIYSWKGDWRGSAIPERMHPEISTTLNLCHATSSPHLSETGVPRQAVLRAAPKWVGTYGPCHPSECGSCFPFPSSKKSACSSPGGAQSPCTALAVAQHLCLFFKVYHIKRHTKIFIIWASGWFDPFFLTIHPLGKKDRRKEFQDFFRCVFFWMNETRLDLFIFFHNTEN